MKVSVLYIFLIAILCSTSCRKPCKCNDPSNPDCENFDPCYGVNGANADFVIEENINGQYLAIGDTVGGVNLHRFRALYDADSFIWTLGAETIHEKQFARQYFPNDRWLTVKLIVFKKRNPNCSGKLKESDTLTKLFYSWDESKDSNLNFVRTPPIYGYYTGYCESDLSLLRSITLHDTSFINLSGQLAWLFRVKGIPYPNTDSYIMKGESIQVLRGIMSIEMVNNNKWYVPGKGYIPKLIAYAWLDQYNKNKIYVEFNFTDTLTNELKKDKFIGYRK